MSFCPLNGRNGIRGYFCRLGRSSVVAAAAHVAEVVPQTALNQVASVFLLLQFYQVSGVCRGIPIVRVFGGYSFVNSTLRIKMEEK